MQSTWLSIAICIIENEEYKFQSIAICNKSNEHSDYDEVKIPFCDGESLASQEIIVK